MSAALTQDVFLSHSSKGKAATTGPTSRKAWPASISSSNNSKCPPRSINNQPPTINSHGFGLRANDTDATGKWIERFEEWLAADC